VVEAYRTEEEQVEALRKWWQENSKSTIAAIVLALAGSFGWQAWQKNRTAQMEMASSVYQDMLEAVNTLTAAPAGPEQTATVRHLAETLKTDYSGSTYAQFAALHLARIAVTDEDLEAAERELRWVLTAGPEPEIQQLTRLRLARVVAARGDTDAALAMLDADASGSYAAAYAEVEGDVYMQLGQPDQARGAYERASLLVVGEGGSVSQSLQLKLEALNPVPARELERVAGEN
jgi:predicted negative regulator of RcsB-dependent stress response